MHLRCKKCDWVMRVPDKVNHYFKCKKCKGRMYLPGPSEPLKRVKLPRLVETKLDQI